MQIVEKKIDIIKPYETNPRDNSNSVDYVANSIKEFGFKVPIVIDSNNVIVAGHTRYKAAKNLGLSKVPCIVADDLTEEQIKAFRLADNKVKEYSKWDWSKLFVELERIDFPMEDFGFIDDEARILDDKEVEEIENNVYEDIQEHDFECPNCHYIDKIEGYIKL